MATTAKMLPPGIMPGKDEIEKYIRLYEDPEFTLGDRITSFDSSTLPEQYIETFCRRYQFYTLVGVKDDYSTDEPVQYRCNLMRIRHQSNMEELAKKELRFWEKKDEKAFKYLRTAFSTAIGSKICVDYLEKQCAAFTPEENARQVAEYKAAEEKRFKEWLEKRERDEDEERLHDLQEAAFAAENTPAGYTIDRDWKRDQKYIPVLSVKFRMLRKALKVTQRDFAKKIGCNANKYALLEQGRLDKLSFRTLEEAFPIDLIKRVVDATYANPYWLEIDDEESLYDVDEDRTAMTVEEAENPWDPYPMFADARVIRYWWVRKI